jgi:hypothetical protein
MGREKTLFPLAQPVSSGSSGVSARFSILPEQVAEPTEALDQAVAALPRSGERPPEPSRAGWSKWRIRLGLFAK